MKSISIFCGAHEGKNPEYAIAAKSVSEAIAKKGINVVFGGGNVGLMKAVKKFDPDKGFRLATYAIRQIIRRHCGLPDVRP